MSNVYFTCTAGEVVIVDRDAQRARYLDILEALNSSVRKDAS